MRYNLANTQGSSGQADIGTFRSRRQRSKPRAFWRIGACAGTIGVMLMFLVGGATSPPMEPGPPYRARPVALAAVRSSHAGYVHTGYVHTGQTQVTHASTVCDACRGPQRTPTVQERRYSRHKRNWRDPRGLRYFPVGTASVGGMAVAAGDYDRATEDLEIWRRGALLPRPRRSFIGSGHTGCMEHLLKCSLG